jgi:hypothetical protein
MEAVMRRLLLFVIIGLAGLGCNRFAGPLDVRRMDRADAPGYTIEEQERRGRARLAITEDDYSIGPKTYNDRPSPLGR